jgi:transcription elongation factor GreA
MTSTTRVWLTPEAHSRLQTELAALLAPADRAENTATDAVDAARRRASRVRELRELLATAVVGEDPPNDGVAEPGMVLTVRYDDTAEEETFLLGLRGAEHGADHPDRDDLEVYSPTSPLGSALTGARPGDQRSYQVPDGTTVRVTLIDAVPYGHHRTQDTATTEAAAS